MFDLDNESDDNWDNYDDYDYDDTDESKYQCSDPNCNWCNQSQTAVTAPSQSAIPQLPKGFHEGADNMAQIQLGKTFSTGNSAVAQLPVGAVLQVSAKGQLEVVELPEAEETHNPGDRFGSKYGPATVVKMTSRFADVGRVVSGAREGFLYVADGTDTVRVVLA